VEFDLYAEHLGGYPYRYFSLTEADYRVDMSDYLSIPCRFTSAHSEGEPLFFRACVITKKDSPCSRDFMPPLFTIKLKMEPPPQKDEGRRFYKVLPAYRGFADALLKWMAHSNLEDLMPYYKGRSIHTDADFLRVSRLIGYRLDPEKLR
jgi:hypothetical protein